MSTSSTGPSAATAAGTALSASANSRPVATCTTLAPSGNSWRLICTAVAKRSGPSQRSTRATWSRSCATTSSRDRDRAAEHHDTSDTEAPEAVDDLVGQPVGLGQQQRAVASGGGDPAGQGVGELPSRGEEGHLGAVRPGRLGHGDGRGVPVAPGPPLDLDHGGPRPVLGQLDVGREHAHLPVLGLQDDGPSLVGRGHSPRSGAGLDPGGGVAEPPGGRPVADVAVVDRPPQRVRPGVLRPPDPARLEARVAPPVVSRPDLRHSSGSPGGSRPRRGRRSAWRCAWSRAWAPVASDHVIRPCS